MNGENLVIVKHFANGKIEVDHCCFGSLIAVYNGYPRGNGWYKLYPVVSLCRDVRFAGKLVHESGMQVKIHDRVPSPMPALTPVPEKQEKTEAPKASPDFKQTSIFDRSYLA